MLADALRRSFRILSSLKTGGWHRYFMLVVKRGGFCATWAGWLWSRTKYSLRYIEGLPLGYRA